MRSLPSNGVVVVGIYWMFGMSCNTFYYICTYGKSSSQSCLVSTGGRATHTFRGLSTPAATPRPRRALCALHQRRPPSPPPLLRWIYRHLPIVRRVMPATTLLTLFVFVPYPALSVALRVRFQAPLQSLVSMYPSRCSY